MSSRTKWRRWQSLTKEEKERSERLRQIREQWRVQQVFYKEHEEKKKKYKKEYERNRAEAMKKEKSTDERRSKNSSPQRREISSSEQSTSKERRTSVIGNGPEGITIDKKELQLTKIRIYTECLPTKNQSTSDKIEQDIINPDDVIVPRRQNEGACPIFQKSGLKKTEEIRTITVSQNEQLEKQLSTSMKNVYIGRRPDDTAQHYGKFFEEYRIVELINNC
ncbi:uncharacterized protein LOC143899979 isoform X2 [Temnothorax americanus]|uniref:uncharacterized protein LOC143899979 isoform X2 n=1 Tax=Temnothorax americanus TaxID=1964332 RepID=UPI0040678D0D